MEEIKKGGVGKVKGWASMLDKRPGQDSSKGGRLWWNGNDKKEPGLKGTLGRWFRAICLVCFEADLLGQKRNEIKEEDREGRGEEKK